MLVGGAIVLIFGFLLAVGTEGGDLDGDAAAHYMNDLKTAPDDARTPEQLAHLFRRGVGGDVEILGCLAQQQIAHRAAHDVALEAGLRQGLAGFQCAIVELVAADAVCGYGQNLRTGLGGARLLAAEYFIDDATNHEVREGRWRQVRPKDPVFMRCLRRFGAVNCDFWDYTGWFQRPCRHSGAVPGP